ncbi:unnamed protein product [Candidula unifasciata]|uniref:G-protein coupled receptors family 1 profile domain-containing protein n=1 Tax=Candidula unifasciata TaxID=100452 RepID=A0A8S3Z5I5_9EUPU|nr:unnamed protein product [Candidula unifasciata]
MSTNGRDHADTLSVVECRFEECYNIETSELSTVSSTSSSFADNFATSEGGTAPASSYASDKESHLSQLFDPSSYERGFNASANAGIFLCSMGIFANLLLFTVLVSSKRLRVQHLYIQVLNIAVADLCFIVSVDSFTVYFELQAWSLGAAFCKTWMILDVALPSVSLMGLLLLNVDRIKKLFRIAVILCPWCCSCIVVNALWLGFPANSEHIPGLCIYGITREANTASNWLTVFIPSLVIFVMLIFIFIAGIGEMPTVDNPTNVTQSSNTESHSLPNDSLMNGNGNEVNQTCQERSASEMATPVINISHTGRQRRFVAALLVVDVISLAITLPYSAYSQVTINCKSPQNCQSFVVLFQILSWMKSSVTCVRPVFFILLTEVYLILKKRLAGLSLRRGHPALLVLNTTEQSRRDNDTLIMLDTTQQKATGNNSYENIILTQVSIRCLYIKNICPTTTVATTLKSPFLEQSQCPFEKPEQMNEVTDQNHSHDHRNETFI